MEGTPEPAGSVPIRQTGFTLILDRITFNHSVFQSFIRGPNGPEDATVKLDTVSETQPAFIGALLTKKSAETAIIFFRFLLSLVTPLNQMCLLKVRSRCEQRMDQLHNPIFHTRLKGTVNTEVLHGSAPFIAPLFQNPFRWYISEDFIAVARNPDLTRR